MGSPQQLLPQMLECIIANTIRNNSPKLFDQLDERGLIQKWLPSTFIAEGDAEIVLGIYISSEAEAAKFQTLSNSVLGLIEFFDLEQENTISTSLRYIKADIDSELSNYHQRTGREIACG